MFVKIIMLHCAFLSLCRKLFIKILLCVIGTFKQDAGPEHTNFTVSTHIHTKKSGQMFNLLSGGTLFSLFRLYYTFKKLHYRVYIIQYILSELNIYNIIGNVKY